MPDPAIRFALPSKKVTPVEIGFTKKDTLALKGVAVMLLLCHHLFTSTERYVNYLIYYTEDDSFNVTAIIAQYAKLCVPMFVMLGAYGLSLVYGKWLEKKRSAVSFVLDRYMSLMAGFLVIFVLGLGIGELLQRSAGSIYGEGVFAWFYGLIDAAGLAWLCGTPTANGTWWYMSFAIVQLALFPMIYALVKRYGLLAVLGFTGFALVGQFNYMLVLLLSSAIGLYLAQTDGFAKVKAWRIGKNAALSKAIKFVLYLLAFAAAALFCEAMPASVNQEGTPIASYYRFVGFDLFALLLCGFVYEFLLPLKPLRFVLAFLGRHSANIFMLHTFLYAHFFPDFYYDLEEPEYIFGMLLVTSLGVSVVIEGLKTVFRYNRLESAVRRHVTLRLNPSEWDET